MSKTAVKSAYLGWLAAAFAGERGASSLTAAAERDIVLGYATGYDVADIAVFVRSLRAHYSGPCALVVDSDPLLRAFLKDHDVEALDEPDFATRQEDWHPHAVVSRFAGFDALLRERPWVRHALLTDVRDVVFQGDPFVPAPRTLEVFAECDTPLKGHDFNMKYMRAIVGDALADAVSDKACICVGTVVGPREALMRFCRLILMLGAIPRSEVGGAFGADQATSNLAVHLGLIEAEVQANYGRVATVGLTATEDLTLHGDQICNPDGSRSPIVHQHDRHAHLLAAMHALWGQGWEQRERVRKVGLMRKRRARVAGSIRKRLPELR